MAESVKAVKELITTEIRAVALPSERLDELILFSADSPFSDEAKAELRAIQTQKKSTEERYGRHAWSLDPSTMMTHIPPPQHSSPKPDRRLAGTIHQRFHFSSTTPLSQNFAAVGAIGR